MTVEEMVVDVYEQLGEDTTLSPYDEAGLFDVTTPGAQKCLGWLNRGYNRVASWQFNNGHAVRFPELFKTAYAMVRPGPDVEVLAVLEDGLVLETDSFGVRGDLSGKVLEVVEGELAGSTFVISGVTGDITENLVRVFQDTGIEVGDTVRVLTNTFVFGEWDDVTPVGAFNFVGGSKVLSAQRFVVVKGEREIERGLRTELFERRIVGDDVGFFMDAPGGVLFDRFVNGPVTVRMDYVALPKPLVLDDEEPVIPQTFHEAIVLWATWWGLRRRQEFTAAYSTKRDLDDLMYGLAQSHQFKFDRSNGGLLL